MASIAGSGRAARVGASREAGSKTLRKARRYNAAETRERILEASWELFCTKGYEHSSTADIARLAAVSEGSIFYHFGSKPELLVELGRMHGQRIVDAMEVGQVNCPVSFEDAIGRFFDYFDRHGVDNRNRTVARVPAVTAQPGEAQMFFRAMRAQLLDWSERQAWQMRPDTEPGIAPALLVAAMEEAVKLYLAPGIAPERRLAIRSDCLRFCTAAVARGGSA
jgi:AcrR family transcriptional regulator